MAKTRVLVVEDSLTVRRYLVDVLSGDPALEVVGEADDGRRAIELCLVLRPDVITMDMMLPVMSGLAATEYIMAHCPVPIVIVSSSTNRGELFHTYSALAAGAVEVVEKPRGDTSDEPWERGFLATVKLVSRIKVITHLRGRSSRRGPAPGRPGLESAPLARRMVAIGASTGGPGALVAILRALPARFPLPILLVLHIGVAFGAALAEWLDGISPLRVTLARDGEPLPAPGTPASILAPPDRHLRLEDGRLRLGDDTERHSCRPSVDVLFESLAGRGPEVIACLLTGMGKDGAAGLLAIRRAGGLTMAQDEATSIVFGMPREAALLGAAEQVLPLDEFAPTLSRRRVTPARGRLDDPARADRRRQPDRPDGSARRVRERRLRGRARADPGRVTRRARGASFRVDRARRPAPRRRRHRSTHRGIPHGRRHRGSPGDPALLGGRGARPRPRPDHRGQRVPRQAL